MWEIIEKVMKEKKLNIRSLASAAGIPATTIYSWKAGKSNPTADKLTKISVVLDVTVDYLMGRTDNPHVSTLDTKIRETIEKHFVRTRIQTLFDELDDENKNMLIEFAEFLRDKQNKNRP